MSEKPPFAKVLRGARISAPAPVPVATPELSPVPSSPVAAPPPFAEQTPTVVVRSPLDSYISERMKSQPSTIEEVERRASEVTVLAERHRMVLPEFFEAQSYDCTWGRGCRAHGEGRRGLYMFRWVFKDKRAVDRALDVSGWTFVNHSLFGQAPRLLFTANGGVENGDALLAFIPYKKALEIRQAPAVRSQELISARMTELPVEPGESPYVLMTGDAKDPRFYKPDLPPESVEPGEETSATEVLSQGKDFA